MFSVEYRERIRELLLEKARDDSRIVAAAAVGGSASESDRWSDLDLTFGVASGVSVESALADWSDTLVTDLDAAVLFDLPHLSSIYRVFLLPGALQVDLSFTPANDFGALGSRFKLIFGEAVERTWPSPPPPAYSFGLGVHHIVRAYFCIERGKFWQAEYWLHSARDEAMSLACRRFGLEGNYGRGFDALPQEVRERFTGAVAGTLNAEALRSALAAVTDGLLREMSDRPGIVERVRPMLNELSRPTPEGMS